MSLYLGKINNQWVHTYSKKLCDEYLGTELGKDYIVVYSLGTGKAGGTKVRGSISISKFIQKDIKGEFVDTRPVLESGSRLQCK